jgi:hypothetical protein
MRRSLNFSVRIEEHGGMKRRLATGGLVLVVALVGWTVGRAQNGKEPSTKEIMTRAHKGGNSLIVAVTRALQPDDPDWDTLQKKTKELVTLGTALGKNEPPQGTKESWERFSKSYLESAKALDAAAQQKNKENAVVARKRLMSTCTACHKIHKPT